MPDPTPTPTPTPTPSPTPSPTPTPTPGTLTLTEEQFAEKIEAAAKRERDKLTAAAKKQQDEADRKAAEEKGEWETLAKQTSEKLTAAETELDALKKQVKAGAVKDQIREALAKDHKAYIGTEKYIIREVEFDLKTSDEDIAKSIKKAITQYVQDNPRAAGGGGVPSDGRSGVPREREIPRNPSNQQPQFRQPGVAGSRF
jgi:hypothetical protein